MESFVKGKDGPQRERDTERIELRGGGSKQAAMFLCILLLLAAYRDQLEHRSFFKYWCRNSDKYYVMCYWIC